jgi:Inner membrane protein YgaP-like, transmembrane domain
MFKTNVGISDRLLRILVGLLILSLSVIGPKSLWGLVGLVPLLSGIFGICPAYSLFGISTCGRSRTASK